jgi:CelD/BcsL family acetyltransferase involved in cellulose biosynthesis
VSATSISSVGRTTIGAVDVAGAYELSVLGDANAINVLAAELDVLAKQSIEFNAFYSSWMLIAALEFLVPVGVMIVVIRHMRDGITGVFPFELQRRFRGLPIPALRSWRHPYCFLCTPLISQPHARETLSQLMSWVESSRSPAHLIEFDLVSGDNKFFDLLKTEMQSRNWVSHSMSYERATFRPAESATTGLSGKHLKELRRLERRLGDEGACTYRTLSADESIEPWIDNFLQLEASGWKGREGTALGSDAKSQGYFRQVALAARTHDSVQMLAIEINGVPVAMKCNFIANDISFAFKIAYDEKYAKYSPGVLLEMFNMKNLVEHCPEITMMDSCAMPDHFMINRLWTGRRTMTNCLAASHGLSALMIRNWPRYHRVRLFLKERLFKKTEHAVGK